MQITMMMAKVLIIVFMIKGYSVNFTYMSIKEFEKFSAHDIIYSVVTCLTCIRRIKQIIILRIIKFQGKRIQDLRK